MPVMIGEDEKEVVGSVVHPTHHHLLKPKNHGAQPRPEEKTLPYLTDRAMKTPPPSAKSRVGHFLEVAGPCSGTHRYLWMATVEGGRESDSLAASARRVITIKAANRR
ncbi:hypothetical protein TanjilG_28714 [Lupinus angustifolius]|uniref:Uncharacterized protein n=1 Tax=Lupinus angustifolius TaxID=3871 RepID=A0A1J7GV85_LUPAN|nr:hypothetical protein TanjilG_28714 [Lupinus angustifolius]